MSVTSFGGCYSPYKFSTKAFSDGQRIWKNRSSIVGRCYQWVIIIRAHLFQNFLFGPKCVSGEFWGLQFSLQVFYHCLFCWPADIEKSIKHCWEMLSMGYRDQSAFIPKLFVWSKICQWRVLGAAILHTSFLPRPFLFASGYGKTDQAFLGYAINGLS